MYLNPHRSLAASPMYATRFASQKPVERYGVTLAEELLNLGANPSLIKQNRQGLVSLMEFCANSETNRHTPYIHQLLHIFGKKEHQPPQTIKKVLAFTENADLRLFKPEANQQVFRKSLISALKKEFSLDNSNRLPSLAGVALAETVVTHAKQDDCLTKADLQAVKEPMSKFLQTENFLNQELTLFILSLNDPNELVLKSVLKVVEENLGVFAGAGSQRAFISRLNDEFPGNKCLNAFLMSR